MAVVDKDAATKPLDPKTFGLVCPKDPNKNSTDPAKPPTHLALDVLEVRVDQGPQLTHEQILAGVRRKPTEATVKCRTIGCEHEFTVKPWPPRAT